MKAMIIFLVFVMQSAAQLLFAQNLTIEVCDIEKVEGHLYVAIYNSEETFMKKPLTAFRIDVKDTSLSIPCQGLPTGTYAISLFQDEYLQPIITQYFIDNKSEIWLLFLIAHSKR